MSDRTRLETCPIGEMQALGAFGRPVHSLYAQLRAVVEARLSLRHANLFAEPVLHSAHNRIDWYASAEGAPVRLADLPTDQAQAAHAALVQLSAELSGLSEELKASANDSDQALGHLIGLSLSTPDDSHVFVVGDQPVLTFWGFARQGGGVQTAPLYGYGGQAAQPAAAPQFAAAAVPVRRSLLPWAMFGIAGLLAIVAVLLILKSIAGVDVPGLAWLDGPREGAPPPAGRPDPVRVADAAQSTPVDDRALVAARERERVLRASLVALESEYSGARAACPAPQRPPSTALVPDRDRPGLVTPRPTDRVNQPDRLTVRPDQDRPVTDLSALDPPAGPDDSIEPDANDSALDDPGETDPAGAPLTISEGERAAQDLAALEGTWRTGRNLMDQGNADPLEIEYAFDADGRGRTTIRLADGVTCTAEAEAVYNGPDAIVITELDHPACSDGTAFEKSEIVCLIDQDGSTICEGAQAGGDGFPVALYEAGRS